VSDVHGAAVIWLCRPDSGTRSGQDWTGRSTTGSAHLAGVRWWDAATATTPAAPAGGRRGTKAAEAKAICSGCQVLDRCLDLAVTAAGGIDTDHGVFGGTLPAERSRLRGNTFPEPSAYRQRRELAEQAHQLAG
jgi:Transcription factor WhiB